MQRRLVLLFLASGLAGLIHESVWARYLQTILGSAAHAQAVTLAVFMGGTAVGAWWAGRRSHRWLRTLRAYAGVELALGLTGLVFHPLFVGVHALLLDTVLPALGPGRAATGATWLASVLLIVPPSVLLGMTFPLMTAALVRRQPARTGESVAILYFANALGGAVGILTGGFLLVPTVGLPGAMAAAGLTSLAVGAVAWRLSGGEPEPTPVVTHPSDTTPAGSRSAVAALFIVAGVTGFSSLAYEIVWVRMLSMLLSSSAHAFELMVAAFVLGLALGGLWIRGRIDRLADPARFLALVQVAMGALAVGTLLVYTPLFPVMETFLRRLPPTDGGYAVFSLGSYAMALAVMLPATICAGMTLPLVTYLLLGMGGGERRIGQAYGLNALGSVLGATVALELGLPALGLEGTLAFAAALDVLLGVLVLTVLGSRAGRVPGLAVASVAAGGAAVVLGLRGIDASLITSGVYRGNVDLSTERVVRMYADGATASVSLVEEGGILSIRTNGKPSASVALDPDAPPTADETVTTLLGALPVLLRPEARTGLNVGLGSGITSSILLGSTALETLTTVEIEPAMMRLSEGFADRNRPVFEDARSRIVIDDARAFLATAPDRFDYIVTQPSNPWVSGAGGLFSIEFYRMASRSLRPGGLLVQWIQASETETALVVSILQALASEFPIYDVYAATGGDLIVVASASGRIPAPAFEGMARPPLVEALERVRIRGPQDILVRKAGNQDTFGALTRLYDVRPNSEFYPVLQENAARARFQGAAAVELLRLMVQPLPVLEFLEVTRPDWTRSDVTLSPNFFYSSRAVTAQLFRDLTLLPDSLRETLTDSIRDPLALPLAGQAERLGHACMVGPTPGEALGELYAIATAVVTDLRPEELRPIWDAMADQPCVAGLAGVGPGWLQFLRTVGERDVRAVAALAPQLLAADASASPARARYAAAAGMAALLRLGRGEEALALFREHRPALFPDEPVSFFFRHLQELARTKSGA